jgi:predicted  nucleic acid-binding Zn-ribbon protein
MSNSPDSLHRLRVLERDVAAAKSLLADLQKQLANAKDDFEREKLEVNIEDTSRQLKDWEYELHLLTAGKE